MGTRCMVEGIEARASGKRLEIGVPDCNVRPNERLTGTGMGL